MFEVKISASGAMRVTREGEGHARPMKPIVAGVASPGLQTEYSEDEIDGSATMRTKAVRAAALRTDHQPGSPGGRPEEYPIPPFQARLSIVLV